MTVDNGFIEVEGGVSSKMTGLKLQHQYRELFDTFVGKNAGIFIPTQ